SRMNERSDSRKQATLTVIAAFQEAVDQGAPHPFRGRVVVGRLRAAASAPARIAPSGHAPLGPRLGRERPPLRIAGQTARAQLVLLQIVARRAPEAGDWS